mmetsp:Transcript_16385/g.34283  ORF Transcript_16385/g.34283 Transcript_16385/m.34283 type:complete len:318 (+) Transcript_16385:642-1595(+)
MGGRAGDFFDVRSEDAVAFVFFVDFHFQLDGSQLFHPDESTRVFQFGIFDAELIYFGLDARMIFELFLLQCRPEDMRDDGGIHHYRFLVFVDPSGSIILQCGPNIVKNPFGIVNILDHDLALPHTHFPEPQLEQFQIVHLPIRIILQIRQQLIRQHHPILIYEQLLTPINPHQHGENISRSPRVRRHPPHLPGNDPPPLQNRRGRHPLQRGHLLLLILLVQLRLLQRLGILPLQLLVQIPPVLFVRQTRHDAPYRILPPPEILPHRPRDHLQQLPAIRIHLPQNLNRGNVHVDDLMSLRPGMQHPRRQRLLPLLREG